MDVCRSCSLLFLFFHQPFFWSFLVAVRDVSELELGHEEEKAWWQYGLGYEVIAGSMDG